MSKYMDMCIASKMKHTNLIDSPVQCYIVLSGKW